MNTSHRPFAKRMKFKGPFKKPRSLVIPRSKWLRRRLTPHGWFSGGFLLNSVGERCCVGFLAKACGIPDRVTRARSTLEDMDMEYSDELLDMNPVQIRRAAKRPKAYLARILEMSNTIERADIYTTNDNMDMKQDVLERRLIRLFKKHLNINLSFVDKVSEIPRKRRTSSKPKPKRKSRKGARLHALLFGQVPWFYT